ncbi:hypothetical protein AAMO2058_000488400 [Amorphochlora amoebiformis]
MDARKDAKQTSGYDLEDQATYERAQVKAKRDAEWYIATHPELSQMIQDFTTAVIAVKPENIREFAKDYFKRFDVSETSR